MSSIAARVSAALERHAFAGADHVDTSAKRFADGAQARIEIPSTEGPHCFAAALEAAQDYGVLVHRVSQGSGVFLHTDAELDEWAVAAAAASVEVSLFARPPAGWQDGVSARSAAGGAFAAASRGVTGLKHALVDVARAADHGFRSVLIGDVGLLRLFGRMRAAGDLPASMQAKVSVMVPVTNPATAELLVELGASTLNLAPDLTLGQIAEIRRAVDVPLDMYVESPDSIGGLVRLPEIAELVRVAAPIYLKFGLRNAPDLYPAGGHLESVAVALTRERVRRARLGLDILLREVPSTVLSGSAPQDLAIPEPSR
jgi:hypothetical protein